MQSVAKVVVVLLLSVVAHAAVYNVGDGAGWTTIGKIDYNKWAATKIFRPCDLIVFKYNPQFHNVMEVSHDTYMTCNTSSPIATYSTGNDTIKLTEYKHYYFICGVSDHCLAGQKVDIHVPRPSTTTSPAPSPSVTPASPPTNTVAPAVSPAPDESVTTGGASVKVKPLDIIKGGFSVIILVMLC